MGLDNSFGNMGVNSCYLFVHGGIRFYSSFSQLLVSVIFIFYKCIMKLCLDSYIFTVWQDNTPFNQFKDVLAHYSADNCFSFTSSLYV